MQERAAYWFIFLAQDLPFTLMFKIFSNISVKIR